MEIKMANKFKYFGIMLDCSRNAVMKIETMKWYLPLLKRMGYNCMFLYTEDTYEVDGEPYFGYMRGRYSQQQLLEIDELASSIGIEVIPCMQTLAHLNATLRWGKIPVDCNDIILVDDERTYEVIDRMFASLSKSFKSRKIHVGMDEAIMLGRGRHLDIHGYEEIAPIMKRHLTRVMEIAKKYDYEVLLWSDMYIRAFNDGEYFLSEKKKVPQDVIESLPPQAIPVYWDYYHRGEEIYDYNFDAHKQLSKNTWFAGGAWTWGGFLPHNEFSVLNMGYAIRSAIKNKIKNVFMTMWGDCGAECSKLSALPALFAISEFAKGNFDMALIKKRFKRLIGIEYDDFVLIDKPNYVDGDILEWEPGAGSPANPSKYMLYSDCFNGYLDPLVQGGEREKYKELSEKLLEISKQSRKYGYIFKTASRLSSALEIKYELGVRTREIYKSGDKAAIRALAENDYAELERRIKSFAEAFWEQWSYENHPSGFDIQDFRLGGLVRRINSCKKRLLDYAAGRIERIEELEEEVLPYTSRWENEITKRPIYVNGFEKIASANIFE